MTSRLFSLFWLTSLSFTALGYTPVREYRGANFFNDNQGNPLWNFYGSWDNLTLYVCFWKPFTALPSEIFARI
jgi:hypothetical protein